MNGATEFVLLAFLGATALAQNCSTGQFECSNGKCIPAAFVCDKDNDCGDESDEPPNVDPALCKNCTASEFRCTNGYCVPNSYVCDRDNDCRDGSDEQQNCPPCPSGTFPCAIGGCVPMSQTCNGNNNCYDWSDESEETCPCQDNEIRCATPPGPPGTVPPGRCIPPEFVCDEDGIWDCPDGSDQANCTIAQGTKGI